MSALDLIIEWAENDLKDWQSDAVRRLLLQEELSSGDKDELLRMIKERNGIRDPENPAPKTQPLKKGVLSGAPHTIAKITLKAIKDLKNVNAIPDGSSLQFGHMGLTVIYGENGSGKSGYARILKRACNARDTKEKLLPNVYEKKSSATAQACIKYSKGDSPDVNLAWIDGEKIEPNILSNICVFDSKCARIIVDENNETTYLPYGTNIFEPLVSLYKELREKLATQKPKPEKLEYADIPEYTRVGNFISNLSYSTGEEDITKAFTWTNEDDRILLKLKEQITRIEIDSPEKQAQRLHNLKIRIISLSNLIQNIDSTISVEKTQDIRQKIANLIDAEKALAIASQTTLSKEPLTGAGEKIWQKLYYAAKDYSIQIAYPGKEFPFVENGSLCVMCMQPLEQDARARMLRFKEFMERSTKKDVDNALTDLERTTKEIDSLNFPLNETYKDIMDDFREKYPDLIKKTEAYFPRMEIRTKEIIEAIRNKKPDVEFQPAMPSPEQDLKELAAKIEEEAKEIEKAARPDEYEQMKKEKTEIESRKLFSNRKQQIIDYVVQLKLAKKYEECIAETEFTGITLKGKQIISQALTPQLKKGLEEELEYLGASHLELNLKASGTEGETKHKIELKGIQSGSKANLSEILSEGEHCVVAIAGFLAELKLGSHECPIIFDDPVCSLDHNYRERIAKRLAEEAKTRQVIVFTHDIAFLIELESKASEIRGAVYFNPQTVCRLAGTVGKCIDGLPWHTMKVKDRLLYLRKKLDAFKGLYKSNQQEYNRKAGELYALLRETWEATVEELLLYETIKRHGKEIQTQRLKSVKVETEDYKNIHFGMTKCSDWLYGHDKSKALSENRPAPTEILEDIEKLSQFVKVIRKRQESLRAERESAIEAPRSEMG